MFPFSVREEFVRVALTEAERKLDRWKVPPNSSERSPLKLLLTASIVRSLSWKAMRWPLLFVILSGGYLYYQEMNEQPWLKAIPFVIAALLSLGGSFYLLYRPSNCEYRRLLEDFSEHRPLFDEISLPEGAQALRWIECFGKQPATNRSFLSLRWYVSWYKKLAENCGVPSLIIPAILIYVQERKYPGCVKSNLYETAGFYVAEALLLYWFFESSLRIVKAQFLQPRWIKMLLGDPELEPLIRQWFGQHNL